MKIQVKNRQLSKVSAKIFRKNFKQCAVSSDSDPILFALSCKSATIADNIWYNQKTGTDVLILPSCRRLQDYKKNLLNKNEDLIMR